MAKKTALKDVVKRITSAFSIRKTSTKAAKPQPEKKAKEKARPAVAKKETAQKISPQGTLKKIAKIVQPKEARKRSTKVEKEKVLEELISKAIQAEQPQEERLIEESKFDIGVPHNAKAQPSYELPFEYQVDRAVVLTVDPRFVFTYWEIKQESVHHAMSRLGSTAKLTLRFYDVSAAGDPDNSPSWDIEVFDRLGNWYLRLDYPEQHLCMDVGMKNDHGHFHRIARSNYIRLPRQTLAAPGPLKWMVVSPDGQKLVTDVEEYTEADLELLKKILGPYFFDLLMRGQFASIAGSSLEAIFQEISAFRLPMEISSSPSSWSGRP